MGEAYRPPMGVGSVWADPLLTPALILGVASDVTQRLTLDERIEMLAGRDGPTLEFWAIVERGLKAMLGSLDALRARPDRRDGRACIAYRLGAEHARMRTYPGLPGPFGPAYAAGWLDAHDTTDRVLWWARSAAEEDMANVRLDLRRR